MKRALLILSAFLLTVTINAQELQQTFISLSNTGVQEFLDKHPDFDGRGTIIFVLDTGVDMGIDGLTKTSTGEVKVIDAQDFTGQGDIFFYEADKDEEDDIHYFVNEDKNLKLSGADKLSLKAIDDYFIGVVPEKLWQNSGSGAADINGNGKEDDQFQFVTFKTNDNGEEYWVVYVDTDSDGAIDDEKPLRNYKEKFDTFTIPNKDDLPFFTIALNIFPDEKRVSFFFDDGSHGSHCAGIAAGFQIGNNPLNGVAPGAKIVTLKIGNNNYSGGATVTESMRKAYEYAAKMAIEREEVCIITMSYGIASEIEARSDLEIFLTKLAKDNPYLYICTSNGNEGPGISTTGLPSSCEWLLSSGAVLAEEVAEDLYGAIPGRDLILHFSSRGGEVNKPDIVSPGACVSTIPNFVGGDTFWGTSMACPYSAGVVSLLMSAVKQEYPDAKIPSPLLFNAVREGATDMEGYESIDMGSGYINVVNSYEILKKYIKNGEQNKFETYTVSSFAPNMPDDQSQSLYIRNGSYITGKEHFEFAVERNNTIDNKKFYRLYNITSDSEWLKPIKKKVHLRNQQGATVDFRIDRDKMQSPGMYNAKLYAQRADKSKFPEFEMMATVIIPYEFNSANKYTQTWEKVKVAPGMHKRYFLNVPAGASTMRIAIKSAKDEFTSCRFYLHNPDGHGVMAGRLRPQYEEENYEKFFYDLKKGVYELIVLGEYTSKDTSTYTLDVEFDGLERVDKKPLSPKKNFVEIINTFDEVKSYKLASKIKGYKKDYTIFLDSVETYKMPFTIKKDERAKVFEMNISKEDFNKTTDFAVMVVDKDGKTQAIGGFGNSSCDVTLMNKFKEDTELTLLLVPGYANKAGQMDVNITEVTVLKKQPAMKVTINGKNKVTLYPSISDKIECKYQKPDFEFPEDVKPYANIYFKSLKSDTNEYVLPVFIKF